jgi:hypothetical protein
MMTFFLDQPRNLLIYPDLPGYTRHQIAQAIPEAKELNGHYLAVPRTLRNSQLLRVLGQPVAPVMDGYDWPIEPGRKPLLHQKLYANFQVLHPRCFNLGSPGTMKTLSSLWAADFLMRQHPEGAFRCLIICPLTIVDTVWASTIFKNFLHRRSVEILHGPQDKRIKLLAKCPDFSIINFDGLGIGAHTHKRFDLDGFSKELSEREDIKLIIVDEARAYGDATTKRSRLARMIIGKKPYLWQLTGSPTPQAPTDCYGMAKLANNAFGKSFSTFQNETMIKVSNFKWMPKRDGYDQARKLLVPAIRFSLNEIWDGPEQTIQMSEVELTDAQKKALIALKRDLQIEFASGKVISATNEGAARWKLLQIVQGAVYDEHHKIHLLDSTPRMVEAERIINSTRQKIVTFVGLTSVLHLLHKRLSKSWRCEFINGEVPSKERARLIKAFESEPDFKVMIVDPSTVSHGVNEFVVADTGIWYSAVDKVENWIQGNGRIRRPGQRYPSTIFQIVSTPTEKEIFKRLETNTSMQGLMLDMVRKGEL